MFSISFDASLFRLLHNFLQYICLKLLCINMNSITLALTALFDRIPRRHSLENVIEIKAIVTEYEDLLIEIEAVNPFYEKSIPAFFDELEKVSASIKKSTDTKASKKVKDEFFGEASGVLKDTIQELTSLYGDGRRTS